MKICGSGVSAPELRELLKNLGHSLSVPDLEKSFAEYDLDGSGKIEFGEFLRLFRKNFLAIEVRIAHLHPRHVTSHAKSAKGSNRLSHIAKWYRFC